MLAQKKQFSTTDFSIRFQFMAYFDPGGHFDMYIAFRKRNFKLSKIILFAFLVKAITQCNISIFLE